MVKSGSLGRGQLGSCNPDIQSIMGCLALWMLCRMAKTHALLMFSPTLGCIALSCQELSFLQKCNIPKTAFREKLETIYHYICVAEKIRTNMTKIHRQDRLPLLFIPLSSRDFLFSFFLRLIHLLLALTLKIIILLDHLLMQHIVIRPQAQAYTVAVIMQWNWYQHCNTPHIFCDSFGFDC